MKMYTKKTHVEFLIDDEDCELVSRFSWYLTGKHEYKKYLTSSIYAEGIYKTIRLHRLIMNPPKGMFIDHIDGNTMDNRKKNLRICTNQENTRNMKRIHNKYGYKGISFEKRVISRFWVALICGIHKKGKITSLGTYATKEEAVRAYDRGAIKYFGEFASTNFPREDYITT
jgi:hypothetical protein